MIKKNKTLLSLALLAFILTLSLTSVTMVSAELNLTNKLGTIGSAAGYEDAPTLPQTIGKIVKGLLSFLGIIFMGYIIYAGQLWMTARGNEEQITKAKAIIRGSIIGLIIVLMAYAITAFVVSAAIDSTGYNPTT